MAGGLCFTVVTRAPKPGAAPTPRSQLLLLEGQRGVNMSWLGAGALIIIGFNMKLILFLNSNGRQERAH